MSKEKLKRNNINSLLNEQSRMRPAKHTQLVHEDTKRRFPVNKTNCTWQKSKTAFKFRAAKHEVFPLHTTLAYYIVGTPKTLLTGGNWQK